MCRYQAERDLAQFKADMLNEAMTHETQLLATMEMTLDPTRTALQRALAEIDFLKSQLVSTKEEVAETAVHVQVCFAHPLPSCWVVNAAPALAHCHPAGCPAAFCRGLSSARYLALTKKRSSNRLTTRPVRLLATQPSAKAL